MGPSKWMITPRSKSRGGLASSANEAGRLNGEVTTQPQVRKENEPLFFEIKTYRYRGHSMSDPAKYRTKDELESYKEQDPIIILQKQLLEAKIASEQEIQGIDEEAKKLSAASVEFAESSEEPSLDALHEDVYAEMRSNGKEA